MSTPIVHILIGPIASDKTRYARRLAENGAVIVDDDAIVNGVHAGDYALYDPGMKHLYKQTELVLMTSALRDGRDVVIDRPNLTQRARRRFIGVAHGWDSQVIGVEFGFGSPAEHAWRRYQDDPRGLSHTHWYRVAIGQFDDYEPARLAEGFDNIMPVDVAGDMVGEPV